MDGKSRTLLDYWIRNRQAQVEESKGLRERLQQLSKLRGRDLVTSIARQNAKAASLLPLEGSAAFRHLTRESLAKIEKCAAEDKVDNKEKKDAGKVSEEGRPAPRSELEAGRVLPFVFGEPASELQNVPLEDLDPFYKAQKTFNVINRRSTIFRFNAEPACYLLSPFNIVRRAAIRVLVHPVSCVLIMLTILVQFLLHTQAEPFFWMRIADFVCTAIYILEAMIKVLSRGFCIGRFTYLRDPWNWLDFLLILCALGSIFIDLGDISALRMFRLLRLLKGRGMRTFACSLTRSVKTLMWVMIFVLFWVCVFALVGSQLFMGSLRQKCIMWPLNFTESYYDEEGHNLETFDYGKYLLNQTNYYFMPGHLDALVCGNASDSGRCPEGFTCMKAGQNPNYGFTNFDNFGWSFLSILRLLTLDFSENLYHLTLRATGRTFTVVFILFFLGSFYLVSLILGVVAMACAEENDAAITEAQEDEEEYQRILEELKKRDTQGKDKTSSSPVVSLDKELEDDEKLCPLGWYRFTGACLKWDCCQQLRFLVMHPFAELFMTVCVVVNTVIMAMEHYPMTYKFWDMLAVANLVFLGIFTLEMVLKIIAMSPYHYFQVGWNIFDSLTVMLNLLELILADVSGLSLLRVFRLGKAWPIFSLLLRIIWNTFRALGQVCLVLAVTVFTFAVVGMQLFGNSYKDCVCKISSDCELPRWHMADLFHSFMTVFRILYGEWIEPLWDCMEVAGRGMCCMHFLSVVVLGSLVVLHLFLGLLLKSFRGNYMATIMQEPHMVRNQTAIHRIRSWVLGTMPKRAGKEEDLKRGDVALEQMDPKNDVGSVTVPMAKPELDFENPNGVNGTDAPKSKDPELFSPSSIGDAKTKEKLAIASKKKGPQDCFHADCVKSCPFLDVDITRGRGKSWWTFRRKCFAMVEHSGFKAFIFIILMLCCVALAFKDIYYGSRVIDIILGYAEFVFICVFITEMLLKWAAYGFKTYFSRGWCWLEFIIVIISVVNLVMLNLGYRVFWGLDVLRALRLVSWCKGPRLVFTTLLGTIPCLINVLLACCTLWLIFGIMGVHLFAGKFFYCKNETSDEHFHVDDVNNRTECLSLISSDYTEVRWVNSKVNFDHVANAYVALLQVATSNGWLAVMYAAMDSRHVDDQPIYESNIYAFFFFFTFICGAFFSFCLLIGSYIDHYAQQKAKIRGKDLFITEEQKRCWLAKLNPERQNPIPRPKSRIQGLVYDWVTKPIFEIVIMVLLLIYMAFLMTESDDQTEMLDEMLYYVSFIYILVITIECGLKIFAFRHYYFKVGWNIFDFFVVIFSILGLFLADFLEKYFVSPALFRIARTLRIICILRLIKGAKGIGKLLFALMRSLPVIFNFSVLFLIFIFISAILGMLTFAFVIKAGGIDDMWNFETFSSSMVTLLPVTTISGWDGLLLPTLLTPPDCDPSAEHPGLPGLGNCGNKFEGIAFFSSYVMISFFIGVNMFIAVILENFVVETEEVAAPPLGSPKNGEELDMTRKDAEQPENRGTTDKPVPSISSDPAADHDMAVIEAKPLMTPVDEPMENHSQGEVTGDVILHSTPSSTPDLDIPANDSTNPDL
ncbi:hypothetical protein GJAV_G00225550 [Gymnothorax javanicus]|nr:hypothetical protein GJAV_G00225550 [Gymnothorax javanicus]